MGRQKVKQTATFAVTLEIPSGISIPEMASFIKNQIVRTGDRHPEDLFFDLSKKDIKVSIQRLVKEYVQLTARYGAS